MEINPIKSENDYQRAPQRVEEIFLAKPNTKEGDELEVLAILIEPYEEVRFPVDMPEPIEAIRFRIDNTWRRT